jgi:phage host-nuclease inhibitor protein Gam
MPEGESIITPINGNVNMWETDFDEIDLPEELGLPEEPERFVINTDAKAEWALRIILRRKRKHDRLVALIDDEIAQLNERKRYLDEEYRIQTSSLLGMLYDFFKSVLDDLKSITKTQSKYPLLTGDLVEKIHRIEYKRDDAKVVAFLKRTGRSDLVKVVETPMWGEFKKTIRVSGGLVVDADGEVVDGVMAFEKPPELEVVFHDERF